MGRFCRPNGLGKHQPLVTDARLHSINIKKYKKICRNEEERKLDPKNIDHYLKLPSANVNHVDAFGNHVCKDFVLLGSEDARRL